MKRDEPAAPHAAYTRSWQRPFAAIATFVNRAAVIAELEARKLRHDPTELFTRAIQPALWLLVFGQVFTHTRAIPTGDLPYIDFMAPGILAQSVLFIAIFYGITVIWERDLGIVHKFLVAPVSRAAIVTGKALSAGVRGLSQAVIVYVLAAILRVHLDLSVPAILGVAAAVVLGAALFSTFSLIVACIVKTRERFMGIGQVLTMPLFFASNAIYPISMMPPWLRSVALGNPLTYEVDALRTLMLYGQKSTYGLGVDFAILAGVTALLIFIAGRLYPRVVT